MSSVISFHEDDDKALVVRLKADDRKAFDCLYFKYHVSIYRNILKLLKDEQHAQDILQEVFYSLWEKRCSLDPDKLVASWLFVVSYNKSISFLKNASKSPLVFEEPEADYPAEEWDPYTVEYKLQVIEKAFNYLSPQKKKVFELCKLQGKSYEEAATELKISKHTVKEYLSEAMGSIRQYIKQHPEEMATLIIISSLFVRIIK